MGDSRIDRILGIIDAGLDEDVSSSCLRCNRSMDGEAPGHICGACRDYVNLKFSSDPASESAAHVQARAFRHVLSMRFQLAAQVQPGEYPYRLRREIYSRQPYEQRLHDLGGKVVVLQAQADTRGYPAAWVVHGTPVKAYGLDLSSTRVADGVLSYGYGVL